MPLTWDDLKKMRISKEKARALKREKEKEEFIAKLKAGEPVLTKKQKRDREKRQQLELDLNVPWYSRLDGDGQRKRKR